MFPEGTLSAQVTVSIRGNKSLRQGIELLRDLVDSVKNVQRICLELGYSQHRTDNLFGYDLKDDLGRQMAIRVESVQGDATLDIDASEQKIHEYEGAVIAYQDRATTVIAIHGETIDWAEVVPELYYESSIYVVFCSDQLDYTKPTGIAYATPNQVDWYDVEANQAFAAKLFAPNMV